ncbi:MAG: S41 family peptidase [Pseudidiomarina maritima]|uniref:S41 family peptidase n=1 Tax=Pseudidiomarina fusca TaxID=2965078 RepID=A0ABU3KZ40_9GAMM|nr:S41 family peptidase [Pseudidiomarina sp. GXY010]MDT7526639.1 S41 family peptidase [Pseudidiomarina sp. GXY010]MDX1526644.1 S41 family peptidase [Pseudidiomarina maritima]
MTRFWVLAAITTLSLSGCGGSDSNNDDATAIVGQCSVSDEKQQFLDYMYEQYFWNAELADSIDPDNYADIYELLDAITVSEDRYSFITTEQQYQDRYVNAAYIGFGFATRVTTTARVFVNYVYQDSPAALAGIKRSDEITHINGESVQLLLAQGRYQEALGDDDDGVTATLTWRTVAGDTYTDVLTKTEVETNTVLATSSYSVGDKTVGYYVLNTFINRTGDDLNQAYNELQGVDELVIDVRYNGGGLTRYANQAATQAAGNNVIGEVFGDYLFNADNSEQNFTELFQMYDGVQQLDLERVYVLTTAQSCSSSELIINALEPFVEVVVIGARTCGKPVGQIPQRICDKRTFVVNFEIVNALGEGRYFNGIAADCSAPDSLTGDWGHANDPMLRAVNQHIETGTCATNPTSSSTTSTTLSPTKPWRIIDQWAAEH